jgi:hypothetical protein
MMANHCTGGTGGTGSISTAFNLIRWRRRSWNGCCVFSSIQARWRSKNASLSLIRLQAARVDGGHNGGGPGASAMGCAVFSYGGSCTITQSTLSANVATGGAGGISRGGATEEMLPVERLLHQREKSV